MKVTLEGTPKISRAVRDILNIKDAAASVYSDKGDRR